MLLAFLSFSKVSIQTNKFFVLFLSAVFIYRCGDSISTDHWVRLCFFFIYQPTKWSWRPLCIMTQAIVIIVLMAKVDVNELKEFGRSYVRAFGVCVAFCCFIHSLRWYSLTLAINLISHREKKQKHRDKRMDNCMDRETVKKNSDRENEINNHSKNVGGMMIKWLRNHEDHNVDEYDKFFSLCPLSSKVILDNFVCVFPPSLKTKVI